MANAQLTRYVARPNAVVCQLHDSLSDYIGKGASIDKHASQLVDAAMTCNAIIFTSK